MISPRMHPKVQLCLFCPPEVILSRIEQHLKQVEHIEGAVLKRHLMLKMKPDAQHYWSPVLNLDIENHGKGSLLKGYFGPAPNVWTLFVALYAFMGCLLVCALVYGLCQMMLEQQPTAFWGVPIVLILTLGVYIVALIGQGLAQEQMHTLRHFFDGCLSCQVKSPLECPKGLNNQVSVHIPS